MNIRVSRRSLAVVALLLAMIAITHNRYGVSAELATTLRGLDVSVFSESDRKQYSSMVSGDIERRRLLAIKRENEAWSRVKTRADWEHFRNQRLNALRKSLGQLPPAAKNLQVETTGRIKGDGYEIENIVFQSRPGLFVTANLYLPTNSKKSMPAILLSHSHHAPKTQGELQDMGMTWARQGWVVLVMDHLGHGERRQHPFVSSDDYAKPFRVGRQDYYFRYNVGLQLQLAGESLVGWMAWDLMGGVDLLCARDDVDKDRIVLIGAVAGGGDPAGVAAALDPRIAAVAPFNFGGPQPDYAIPKDAQDEFYYFGVAYWETTRCLRLGGRDGFAHWVIVGSVAPRRLIYSFEFGWERKRDPVWPRLEKVFALYDARDHLDVATGRGHLKGRPPENTHCGNVGVFHRRKFYPHLARWFDMEPPVEEFQQRRETKELMCLSRAATKKLDPQPVFRLASRLAAAKTLAARQRLESLDSADRRKKLREGWARLLGDVTPAGDPKVVRSTNKTLGNVAIERVLLEVEDGIVVPIVFLRAAGNRQKDSPIVVAFARAGKGRMLEARSEEFAALLAGGAVVCLPDLRGTGETSAGNSISRRSTNTTLSCREQVLGQTLLGSRLRDLRSVLRYLRGRQDLGGSFSLWGDSLAAVNPKDRSEAVPLDVENPNVYAEPTGGLLALLGALFENDVEAIYASGTLASFGSLLNSHFLYLPHDAVVPSALTVSDVSDIAAAIAPCPLKMDNLVDGCNRQVSASAISSAFATARKVYRRHGSSGQLSVSAARDRKAPAWLLSRIKQ